MTVEFKRAFRALDLNDRELVEAAACLANGAGGTLFLGVEDDGTVTGVHPRHGDRTDPVRLAVLVQNRTTPALAVGVDVETIDGVEVVRVDVPRADPGPIGTSNGVFTRRVMGADGKPECLPMTVHEIVSGGLITQGMDYAASVAAGAELSDLDPQEFERFRRLSRAAGSDDIARLADVDILRALGLIPRSDPVSLGAVLLFGTRQAVARWVPTAEVLFQDRRAAWQTNERLTGPLLRVAEELRDRLDDRDVVTELMAGMQRIEIPLIPTVTRREAVANALLHRDYAQLGPTVVQITDSEFTVASPGGFPPGITVTNLLEQSRPRSPVLADAFRRAGLVDRLGKGVNDMFEQQLRAGRDVPDYSRTTGQGVVVTVPLGTADLDVVRFLLVFENEHQTPLHIDELRVVHEVKAAGSASVAEMADALAMVNVTVRNTAARLVEKGLLESRGSGRSRRFHLTARFYDVAQDRNAYVRVKGADPLQQRRMIIDYVEAYGSISRAQTAQLCQISPVQARRVLKGLVEEGTLQLVGERRGSRYQRPRA